MSTSQNLGTYSPAFFKVNGNMFMEEVSISLTRKSNAQRVFTVPKGLAGPSLGSSFCEFSMDSAVPLAGVETPGGIAADRSCVTLQVLEFDLVLGQQNCVFNGWIEEVEIQHSANQVSKVVYKGVGEYTVLA